MRLIEKLKPLFSPQPSSFHLDVAVRCSRCGEVIHARIDTRNDLSVQYGQRGTHYFCRKVLMGSGGNRCFQQIVIEYTFDADRNVIDRRIEGGSFVDQEDRE
jgi:hypothetical protein